MPRIVAVGAAVFLALVAAGCDRPAREHPPVGEVELRACPPDDAVWERAIAESTAAGTLDELHALAREIADACPARWEPAWAAGEALYRLDRKAPAEDFERMRDDWDRALERAIAAADASGVSRAAEGLGVYFKRRPVDPDLDAAERMFNRALEAAERADRDDLRAYARNELAGVLRTRGRLAEAIAMLEQAALYAERAGLPTNRWLYNQAVLLEDTGQLARKRQVLERVYQETVAAGDDRRLAMISVSMGNLLLHSHETDAAREWFSRVPADSDQAPNAALGLGRLALDAGDHAEAARQLDRAIATGRHGFFALLCRTFRAEVDLRTGRPETARAALDAVIAEADEKGVRDVAAVARTLLGKVLVDLGDLESARQRLGEAIEIIEGGGRGLDPTSGGLTYLRERAEAFVELAALRTRETGPDAAAAALDVVERAHARALRQILGIERSALVPASLGALQGGLDGDELILDYLIGEDRGALIAIARDEVRMAALPGWKVLRAPLTRYLGALKRPLISVEARHAGAADLLRDVPLGLELRESLLGPVEDLVARARRVYVVPDRDLALLPFAALPDAGSGTDDHPGPLRFLGDAVDVAVLPLAGQRPEPMPSNAPLLLAGDPLPGDESGFSELPLAARELDGVAAVWRGEPITWLTRGGLTSEALLRKNLRDFRTLHFATHAVASSRDPDRCAVILSGSDRLGLRRIAALELGPSLVVLSACRTGEGEMIPGEGVVGLTWAFLSAGARTVVASLWSVDDTATSDLMVEFHRGLQAHGDPVAALAAAQRRMAGNRRHPAYWAPFVVVLGPEPTR